MFRVNVGFLLKQAPGYSREMEIDEGHLRLAEDVRLEFLRGTIRFTRTHEGLLAQGRLRTEIACDCVRCLTDFALPLAVSIQDLFYYPASRAVDSELIIPEDGNIEFGPLIREDVLLSIPMHALCRPDCAGLCPQCGQNWNEGTCMCADESVDPRWAELDALRKAG
jgi:uncharacterized protein